MKTNKKIFLMGIIVLLAGTVAALISFAPSRILQYAFVLTSLGVGIFGLLLGRKTKNTFMRPTYFLWIGFAFVGLAIALFLWATNLTALVNIVGFYLLFLALVEFVFALRILIHETPIPWKIVGLKLTLSATTAIGSASILALAGFNIYTGLMFFGVLFVIVGLTFIQLGRIAKGPDVHA